MNRTILHSDCNCFYASVELLYHPELRGKLVAVGGDSEARHGIVLTADYTAKRHGVKTGMALWQARQACPDIIFLPPRTSMQTSVECETYDMPGYAIDDTSQYRGKENVPYVDSASAWDRENGRLNLFVLNRNEESEYSLTVDVRGFEGYRFVKQFEMYTDDLEASSSFDNPSLVLPKEKEDILFADGRLTTSLKPLSWNVLCFEKEEE